MRWRKKRQSVIVAHKLKQGIFAPGELRPGEIGIDVATGSLFWSTDGYNVYSCAGRLRGGLPFDPRRGFYSREEQDYVPGVIR